jgi:hypothetical protein
VTGGEGTMLAVYATFIQLELFHLSMLSASKKIVFTGCSVLADFISVFCIVPFGL